MRLPFIVSHRVILKDMAGKVVVTKPWEFAMIRIGFGDVAIFDRRRSRSIWNNKGEIVFNGTAYLDHGTRISVEENGHLVLGKKFRISAESTIICRNLITFGDNCLLSWQIQIMDSDLHMIENYDGVQINKDAPIHIQDHVWISSRAMILKGSEIASNCVVAANSVISNRFKDENLLIGGVPAKILKTGIVWKN